jgi:hypothetical protein
MSPNAPTVECKQILNSRGFCVLSRDQLYAMLSVLNSYLAIADFETSEEEEILESTMRKLQMEIAAATSAS